jgi:nucleotide-binding universal stress UspA family protein
MSDKRALSAKNKKEQTQPFAVRQALIGLEMSSMDPPLLKYLHFLQKQLPIAACRFLHVVPEFAPLQWIFSKDDVPLVGEYELNQAFATRMQASIKEHLAPPKDAAIDYHLREGDALDEILSEAQEIAADLVIIGQKSGRGTHGIRARNIARKSNGNVLIVPEESYPRLQSILVPVDFSENAAKALVTALAINAQLTEPAKIIAINVYQMPDVSAYKISRTPEQFQKMIEAEHTKALDAFIDKYVDEGRKNVFHNLLLQDGSSTAHNILQFANENNFDLIVMGAKGHSRVEQLLMGSVTESLLTHNASIPALIVK